MSTLVDLLRGISELLLGPAYVILNRHDDQSHDRLAQFLEALVGKYADEGVQRTVDPMSLMLQGSSLTARTIDEDSPNSWSTKSATSTIDRVVEPLGWAFRIEGGAARDVERLTQILDAELNELRSDN